MASGKGTVNPRCISSGYIDLVWCGRILELAIYECQAGIQPVHCCAIKKKDGEVRSYAFGLMEFCADGENTLKGYVICSSKQAALDGMKQFPLRNELYI